MPESETEKGLVPQLLSVLVRALEPCRHILPLPQPVPWPKAGELEAPGRKLRSASYLTLHLRANTPLIVGCTSLRVSLMLACGQGPLWHQPMNDWSRTTNSPSLIVDCLRETLTTADQWLRRMTNGPLVTGWGWGLGGG